MILNRSFMAALAAAAVAFAVSGGSASAATEDEHVDIPAQAEYLAPQPWQLRDAQVSPSRRSRLGSLADRCRPVNEYAQLGEFDDESLNFLRRGCR